MTVFLERHTIVVEERERESYTERERERERGKVDRERDERGERDEDAHWLRAAFQIARPMVTVVVSAMSAKRMR